MAVTYYTVYSVRSRLGTGFGRNTLICDRAIETMDQIEQAEKELLRGLREKEPLAEYGSLFLVNWREIVSAQPTPAVME